ncbi:hypothetical protein Bhyg_17391, partial [Pseudolycoriella hygida]
MFHKILANSFIIFVALNVIVQAEDYTNFDENYGKTWMYFPDGDGVPQIVNLTESPFGSTRSFSVKNQMNFELYTRVVKDERLLMPSDQIKAEYMLDDGFDWIISEVEDWRGQSKIFSLTEDIVWFTNGSKEGNSSGAGYSWDSLNKEGAYQS